MILKKASKLKVSWSSIFLPISPLYWESQLAVSLSTLQKPLFYLSPSLCCLHVLVRGMGEGVVEVGGGEAKLIPLTLFELSVLPLKLGGGGEGATDLENLFNLKFWAVR